MSSPATAPMRDAAIPWQRAIRPGERADAEPGWHRRFRGAWEALAGDDRRREDRRDSTDDSAGLPADLGLLEVARPLIADARRRLRGELAALRPEVPGEVVGPLVREPPFGWLTMAVQPALTHELAAAARAGTLKGTTPQERYAAFVRGLADADTALPIWAAYPVLARQIVELLDNWVAARLAFARDLTADLPAVTEAFGTTDGALGRLTDVAFGAAETHRGGRSVALVRFERAVVVYKPRGLAIDLCFDRLLGWFNDHGPPHPLRRPRLLDRGDHGWSEYIAPEPCPETSLTVYFWRMGALLALTHAVRGFDLHADNVIAAGPNPVVVDLEALFHTEGTQPMARRARLGDPAADRLAESVVRTGLLPGPLVMPDVETERPFGVDISPLGIATGRRSLIPTPIPEEPGTDRMRIRLGYRDVPAPAGRLRTPDGGTVDPRSQRGPLVNGYTFAYQRLAAAGEGLLAPGGPLHGCADVPVRLIQLSTFLYVRLLLESWQPHALRDAADRERGLNRLAVGWPGVPHRATLLDAERAALWRGEVPVFELRPGHRDLWVEDGTRLPGVLTAPPLAEAAERLAGMGPDDLAAQVEIIDASLAALGDTPGPPSADASTSADASADEALREAVEVARRLNETAVRSGDRIGWLTIEVVDATSRRVAPAGLDLYGGLPGIGFFLSHLSAVASEDWATDLAVRVAEEVVHRCRAATELSPARFGLVSGLGPAYYLAHAAAVHGRTAYAEAARDLLLRTPPATTAPPAPDVLEGTAGTVLSALALHAVRPDPETVDAARTAGERLLVAELAGPGFGYGASGAAVALARLHALVPDQRHASRSRALIAAEADPGADAGWCQGAAGIGLACLELRDSPAFASVPAAAQDLERSLERAAAVVRDAAPPQDDSLCHGTFARLELLGALDQGSLDQGSLDQGSLDQGVLSVPAARSCRTALPAPVPGLFGGLAGVGFGLLRLARPEAVPSVLTLAPPRGCL